jgi:AcrR family transcriptional regulator
MPEQPADTAAENSSVPTEEQIIASARKCFEAAGIRKTTVEDIAAAAGVSRQTVYKYFSNKQDIADRIGLSEMMEVQGSLRRKMTHYSHFADKITEAVWVSAKVAKENPYIRRMMEDLELLPGLRSPSDPIYLWHRAQWDSVLNAARKSGELAPHLGLDQIVLWLSMAQLMMVIVMDKLPQFLLGEDEIREFIRRFIVDPLLAEPISAAGSAPVRTETLRHELDSLRALVAEQALEIRALKRGGGP